MARCGAKTRSGRPCKGPAMENGRCRMHGGKATKTHAGNQNAAKHGIYSQHLTEEERAAWDEIELGRVDDELRLTRIRLARALAAENASGGEPELEEISEQDATVNGVPLGGDEKVVTRKSRRRDYAGIIDRLTGRIESLERTRVELMKALGSGDDGSDLPPAPDYVLSPDEAGPENPVL